MKLEILVPILSALLTLSITGVTILSWLFRKQTQIIRRLKISPPKPDIDARAILHDLTGGEAVVRITRIEPGSIFLRSPRDMS